MKHMIIKPISIRDIGYLMDSLNNPLNMRLIGSSSEISYSEAEDICSGKNRYSKWFLIKDDELKRNIGIMSLLRISEYNKSADLSITISDEEDRRKGYGIAALKWLLEYAFNTLFLHRIQLEVLESNLPAESLYKKIGFKQEGIKQDAFYNGQEYTNLKLFSLLRNEWDGAYVN